MTASRHKLVLVVAWCLIVALCGSNATWGQSAAVKETAAKIMYLEPVTEKVADGVWCIGGHSVGNTTVIEAADEGGPAAANGPPDNRFDRQGVSPERDAGPGRQGDHSGARPTHAGDHRRVADTFVDFFRVRIDPKKAQDTDQVVQFVFTDKENKAVGLHVRRGVVE